MLTSFFREPSLDKTFLIPFESEPNLFHRRRRSALSEGIETETDFRVSVDMPGVKADDVKVESIGDEVIEISATRRHTSSDGSTVKRSRIHKAFMVDSSTIDLKKLSADLTDGVLEVTAPKKLKPKATSVKVTTNARLEDDSKSGTNLKEIKEAPQKNVVDSKATAKANEIKKAADDK